MRQEKKKKKTTSQTSGCRDGLERASLGNKSCELAAKYQRCMEKYGYLPLLVHFVPLPGVPENGDKWKSVEKNLCNFSRSEFFFFSPLFGFFLFFFLSPVEQLVRSALHFRRVRSPHKRMCACGYVISGKWGQRVSKSRPTFALINHELRFFQRVIAHVKCRE